MSHFFCYTDVASNEVLLSSLQKVLLIGSDLGYESFGGIMQHKNILQHYKRLKRYSTVLIVNAEILNFVNSIGWARKVYGADAFIFVSEEPLTPGNPSSELFLLTQACNITAIHLYGSSFSTNLAPYVIRLTEYFLSLSQSSSYFISGLNVPHRFQKRMCSHIQKFTPLLVGIRNEESEVSLLGLGLDTYFSFDDATEALQQLAISLNVCSGRDVMVHLDTSSCYFDNSFLEGLRSNLLIFKESYWGNAEITLLQANRGRRSNIFDAHESLKLLDLSFPFYDFRLLDLAALAYCDLSSIKLSRSISARIGFSCSSHIALFLELAGVPCWLHQMNEDFVQTGGGYGTRDNFNEFLNEPRAISYERHLERRREWLNLLDSFLLSIPDSRSLVSFEKDSNSVSLRAPAYKKKYSVKLAEPLADHLDEEDNSCAITLQQRLDDAEIQIEDLLSRLQGLSQQLTDVGSQARAQKIKADKATLKLKDKTRKLRDFEENFKKLVQVHKLLGEHSFSDKLIYPVPLLDRGASDNLLIKRFADRFWNLQQRIGIMISQLAKENHEQ